jgi:hypothetical protein
MQKRSAEEECRRRVLNKNSEDECWRRGKRKDEEQY